MKALSTVLMFLGTLILLSEPSYAQTVMSPCVKGTGGCSPVTATNPLPIGVYGGSGAVSGYCLVSNGPNAIATFQSCTVGGGVVTSITGDGTLISNSASSGAVTLTIANATAKSIWGNTSSSSAAPGYQTSPVVSGSMTADTLVSTVATGTAPLTVSSTTQVTNLNAATAGTATNSTNSAITDDTSTNASMDLVWVTTNTGNLPLKVSSSKLQFNPSSGSIVTGIWNAAAVTSSGIVTGTALVPSSSTVATNGVYLAAANTPTISANSLDVVRFLPTTSAVDYLTLKGAATASPALPEIAAVGSDTNISIVITPKGSGIVSTNSALTSGGKITANNFDSAGSTAPNNGFTQSAANVLSFYTGGTLALGLGSSQAATFASTVQGTQFTSTISTGTAPFVVSSTTQVANLNAATAGSATSATNATNGATVAVSNSASYFPLFVASSSNGNQAFNLGTGLSFNPSTNVLTTTTFSGALSGNATTSTTATNATNTAITDDTTTNATMYLTWVTAATGNLPQKVSSTKFTVTPSTGVLAATTFSGAGTSLTGTAASLTAGTVTTNANLTGPVTSSGNATTISANAVTLAMLETQATNTVLGNATSGTAVPTALAVGSCSTAGSAIIWTTNTGFGCNTSITAASVAVGGITGLGTGVATALAVNTGTAGAFVVNGGALGTPSSGTATNITGLPTTALTGALQAAQEPAHTGDVTNSAGSLATTVAAIAGTTVSGTTGTTNVAFSASPTFTGTVAMAAGTWTTTLVGTSTSATALVAGANGTTNPAFTVDASTASSATGITIKSAAAAALAFINVTSSGADESLSVNPKGTGAMRVRNTSTSTAAPSTLPQIMVQQIDSTVNNSEAISFRNSGGGINAQIEVINENHNSSGTGNMKFFTYNAGTGTAALTISSAQLVALPVITSDATHTDASVCEDTTSHALYAGSGTVGICLGTSSARYKNRIKVISDGLAQIKDLKPITFFYNKDRGDYGAKEQYGFLAEDVVKVLPKLVGLDKDKKPNSVDILGMVPILVKAVQELKADNDNLHKDNDSLHKDNAALHKEVNELKRKGNGRN